MMYYLLTKLKCLLPLLVIVIGLVSCQNDPTIQPGLSPDRLESAFQTYKEPSLTHRRFKHSDIVPLIVQRGQDFKVEALGQSIKGRDIYQLAYGEGTIKVLLWSQMHGNESTATMALFDLFNFLEGEDDDFVSLRHLIK